MLFTLSFMCPKIIIMCVVIKTRYVCIVHKAVNEYEYIYIIYLEIPNSLPG